MSLIYPPLVVPVHGPPGPRGPRGPRGLQGPPGTGTGGTPTISVGTVETVPDGSEPYLTITGDGSDGYIVNVGFPSPSASNPNYKGEYDTSEELISENPNSVLGDYGYSNDTNSFWYYSPTLGTYVNQEVTVSEYMAHSTEVRDEIPFIIIPG